MEHLEHRRLFGGPQGARVDAGQHRGGAARRWCWGWLRHTLRGRRAWGLLLAALTPRLCSPGLVLERTAASVVPPALA